MNAKSVSDWVVGITTAPRPRSTLKRTVASLRRAGWAQLHLFDDDRGAGAWRNWIDGLAKLIDRHPAADAYMMVQDDAVFCRNLRSYLEYTLWPATDVVLCSPYCPTPYARPRYGWHQERRGWGLVGAVCWVLPPDSARDIVNDLGRVAARSRIDARIGQWAKEVDRSVWYHAPSLVQHVGLGNSALGDAGTGSLRMAADFLGEEAEP